MNILDFEESESFEYDTVQKVWGSDVRISVTFENEERFERLEKEEINLRGVVRPLSERLKFVEENRDAIDAAVLSANIEGFSEEDLKTLNITWMLFVSFVDTGNRELIVYLESDTDVLDGAEIALTVYDDNTVTFDDICEDF